MLAGLAAPITLERRFGSRLSRSNAVVSFAPEEVVVIRYTNYRGETAVRRIVPIAIRFGSTQWHPSPQWLLEAFDLDRDAQRSFAVKDVLEWRPDPEVSRDVQAGV